MKEWPANHPKAKAMIRKRAAILAAAKTCFLKTGYGGTSMEAIAEAAGISLMTLYRHAESKDDLFGAVVSGACNTEDEEEQQYLQQLWALPLPELLVAAAVHMQGKLTRPDTIALMRVVIAEAGTFPHLAALAYDGFVAHFERIAAHIISEKTGSREEARVAAAARAFVDRVVGSDTLRILLGQPEPDGTEKERRGMQARDDALGAFGLAPA